MSAYCTSCGSPIPDGQGSSCSMCYGDIEHGKDGYYRQWAEEQEAQQADKSVEAMREQEAEQHFKQQDVF